jgi:hypothetical protein
MSDVPSPETAEEPKSVTAVALQQSGETSKVFERQAKRHMQRVAQAIEAKKTPTEAQRRYGSRWQSKRRQAERAIRIATVAFRRWAAQHNIPMAEVAKALDIPERTLSSWENDWQHNHLCAAPRGRKTERTPVERRNEVIAIFRLMGPHVGAPILGTFFPEMPRRELEDLVRRLKFLHGQQRRIQFFTLRWLKPGTAWAIDHSQPPAPIEGTFRQILSIRDLAAQAQLAWTPVLDGSALHVRLVLETLIAEHGAPLLLKKDNGSALNDEDVNRLLACNGIIGLLSPRVTPSYNGACEAGNGSMKVRTSYEAARNGRPTRWSVDDCEAARLQALRTARPWGVTGPTPEQVWSQREPITAELRQRFLKAVPYWTQEERNIRGYLPGIVLASNVEASINRVGIRRALVACRLLEVRRGRIALPFSS